MLTTRRELLTTASTAAALAAAPISPAVVLSTAPPAPNGAAGQVLVVIHLAGGNDGLNTLVPYGDDNYYRLRPELALPQQQLLRVDDHHGLHPALKPLQEAFAEGRLALLQGVGYPEPNRSHFRSTEIWETAMTERSATGDGWLGRALSPPRASAALGAEPVALYFGRSFPQTFAGAEAQPILGVDANGGRRPSNAGFLERLAAVPARDDTTAFLKRSLQQALAGEQRVFDIARAYRADAPYGNYPLARSLRTVAALIAAGDAPRVFFATLAGFDTHSDQLTRQAQLLKALALALAAFDTDLRAKGLADRVVLLTVSEFGRRPQQNGSKGTDHGTASVQFCLGTPIRGGLFGEAPDLAVPENGDVAVSLDFRRVYATLLDRWLGAPAAAVLGPGFKPLDLLHGQSLFE